MDMFGDSDDEGGQQVSEPLSPLEQLRHRPKNCGVAAFHEGTEESLLLSVEATAAHTPQSVLAAMDAFCYGRHWMMHIGEVKGIDMDRGLALAVAAAKRRQQPVVVVELGSYCGYSAVRLAMQLDGPGDLVISVDSSDKALQWARRAVAHCGLAERVSFVCSSATDCIPAVEKLVCAHRAAHPGVDSFGGVDLLLIDHDKALYHSDLLAFEAAGLLPSGAIVVSDNVLSFGQPKQELLDHVRDTSRYSSSVLYTSALEYSARSLLLGATESKYRGAGVHNWTEEELDELRAAVEAEDAHCETTDGLEISIRR
jgi:catechol O-methyltransferase